MSFHINEDKEEAIKEAKRSPTQIQIFTDGSAHSEGVGAAAIMWKGRSPLAEARINLGPTDERTIFEAELIAILMAVGMLRKMELNQRAVIFSDSQAAIKALKRHGKYKTGAYIIIHIHKEVEIWRRNNQDAKLRIQWVPGHSKVTRNEKVDEAAKKAAAGIQTHDTYLPNNQVFTDMPISAASLRCTHRQTLRNWARNHIAKSPRFQKMHAIDPSVPSPHFMKATEGLTRPQRAAIMQLRTGHSPLNEHLSRIGKTASSGCQACGAPKETTRHFLVTCPAYEQYRKQLRRKIGRRAQELRYLLSNRNIYPELLTYIDRTRRLRTTFGELEIRDRKAFIEAKRVVRTRRHGAATI